MDTIKIVAICYFGLNILTVLWFLMSKEFILKRYQKTTTVYIEPRRENSRRETSTFFEQYYVLETRVVCYWVASLLFYGIIICWSLVLRIKPKTEIEKKNSRIEEFIPTGKFIEGKPITEKQVTLTTETHESIYRSEKFIKNYNQHIKTSSY